MKCSSPATKSYYEQILKQFLIQGKNKRTEINKKKFLVQMPLAKSL